MLLPRALPAAVRLPLFVAAILFLPTPFFSGLIGLLVLLGAREMAQLGGLKSVPGMVLYVVAVAAAMWVGVTFGTASRMMPLFAAMAAGWVLLSVFLVTRRQALQPVEGLRPFMLVVGGIMLVVAWLAVIQLHAREGVGAGLVLFLFVLIWVADSGAYFAGRALGKRKLAPAVSPGKTWAGVGGAMVGAVLCGLVLQQLELTSAGYVGIMSLCLLVTAVSIGGDLFESVLKRQAGVKDSGRLLPGHGGVLDRIDSLIAAAPVFAVGLALAEQVA